MKKLAIGCAIVLAIALVGFGVAGYYAYRWAQPMIQNAGDYLDRAREMSRLGDRVANKAPYIPPASGELTQSQVERYLAVQTRVREEMATRWAEIESKAAQIQEKTKGNQSASADGLRRDRRELTFAEFTSALSDLSGLYMDARRVQVNALNVQKFSDAEYSWVRLRVYEAAGIEVANGIDMSRVEELAREGALKSNVKLPDMPKPQAPETNRKLIKPHLAKLKDGFALAFLGL